MQQLFQTSGESPVWIFESHPLAAEYLRQVLSNDPRIMPHVIHKKMPSREELGSRPLFILDNSSLEISVELCMRNLNTWVQQVRYIVLDHELQQHTIYQWLSLGIHGFLVYEQVPESLVLAIHTVTNGGMWVEPQILHKFMHLDRREQKKQSAGSEQRLTAREEQIFHLAERRLSNKEIAAKLNIEVSTVKFHLSNIFSKLQITGKSGLWQDCPSAEAIQAFVGIKSSHIEERAT
jgi:DNA-binding NarL/FixJ family response regulator